MREINVEQLEERARALESEVASAGLLRLLLGDSTGAATPGRYRFLHEAIDERPVLRRSLLDGKVKTIRSEWAQALADRQSDARFLHGLAVLYREKALAGLANGNAEPDHWVIGTALWSLLLCSDKFWHYFSQARSTSRETAERSDLEFEKQEALLEESVREILSLHRTHGSLNFAAGRYDQAVVHLRCLAICQEGRDVLLAALEEQGFQFKLAFDEARLKCVQTAASELLDDWCATLVREADKVTEDAEVIKRLPKGIQKNYEGGIEKLQPFINLNISVKRVLRASLEWYNDWCYDLHVTNDRARIQELMKPACAVADQLVPLCIKGLGHTPENQSLSMHFLLRGFTCGLPEQAIDEYKEALSWNPANENAQNLLGDSAQAVLMEQLNTAIECMKQKKFTEAYEVLDSVEERATEKDAIKKARAIVCFHHGNALADDGKFREALERGHEAQRLDHDQEVIDEFVKMMEELAPEEENLRHLGGAQEAFEEERYDQCITKAGKVSPRSKHLGNARRLQSAAYFHRAIAAAKKKDLTKAAKDKAEKDIRKALELNDDPEEREIISQQMEAIIEGDNIRYLNEAQEAMEAEKYDNCLTSAAKVSPKSKYISHARQLQSLAYFHRGIAEANQGRFDRAEADLTESLELNDNAEQREAISQQLEVVAEGDNVRHLNTAQEAFEAERYDDCIRSASQVSSSSTYSQDSHRMQSLAYFRRGMDAVKRKRFDQAEADLKKALELNHDAQARKTITEQIEALAYGRVGIDDSLMEAFESRDWATAETILRNALRKNAPREVKRQLESQLSSVLNQRGVQRANEAQTTEGKFGTALQLIGMIIQNLQKNQHLPGSRQYQKAVEDKACPVCNQGSSWGSGRGRVVEKVFAALMEQGRFSFGGATQFWLAFESELCYSCKSDLRSISDGKREAIGILEEAVRVDAKNTAARQNLDALRQAL